MGWKTIISELFAFTWTIHRIHSWRDLATAKKSHVFYPSGKPTIPHLRRCQGFAVGDYSFILDALDLRHSRLLQRSGKENMIKIMMKDIGSLPQAEIADKGPVSHEFLMLGIRRIRDACHWVRDLPYGYNSNHEDSLIIFQENRGVCYTKHGAIARLGQENNIDIKKCMGFYRLDNEIIPHVQDIISPFGLDYLPQIHCFLKYKGDYFDLTEGNCTRKNKPIVAYDYIVETEPDMSEQQKNELYVTYLKKYMGVEPKLADLGTDKVLEILATVNQSIQNQCAIENVRYG